jgi:orotidine-5'-phosphate decarboxylase
MLYDEVMPIPEQIQPSFAVAKSPAIGNLDEARRRLIVALDVPVADAANALVRQLEGACQWFKIGLELFVAAGPAFVESLVAREFSVFLDLKFHDIPHTVTGAVRSAARLGAQLLTVHAGGGPAMLSAACQALEGVSHPPQLLAVTVLTSMDDVQLKATGANRNPANQAALLAEMAWEAGIRGFVCSPEEVGELRTITGPEGVFVVPGIRPAGSEAADQKRLATPARALQSGASYLVVGRPITQAADPRAAAEAILVEMAGALQ